MLRKLTSILMICTLLFCCVGISAAEPGQPLAPLCVAEVIQTDNFVSRLAEFENTPNAVGYLRQDGAKTVYLFDQDIRYLNNGTYVEKTTLSQSSPATSSVGSSTQHANMMDAFVSSAQPDTCFGEGTTAYIGTHDTYGTCRMFIRFVGLATLGIDYNRVISAYYHVTDNTPTTRSEIEAYYVTEDWNERAVTWNDMPNYDGNEIITTLNIPNVHGSDISDFYITQAVKGWLQGIPSYGILLKDKDDENLVTFATKEDTTAANYLSITYYDDNDSDYVSTNTDSTRMGTQGITSGEYYYIYNKKSGLFLTAESASENAGIYQNNLNGTHLQRWKLTYNTSGNYYTMTCGTTGYNLQVDGTTASNLKLLKTAASSTGTNQRWQIVRNWDGSYKIASLLNTNFAISVAASSTNDGAFACLYQHTVNRSREDDWTILPVTKKNASIYYYTDSAIENGITYTSEMNTFLNNDGFSSSVIADASMQSIYTSLHNNSIVIYKGHGEESFLHNFTDPSIKIVGSGRANNLYAINDLPYNQLSDLQMFLGAGCLSGRDSTDNSNIGLVGSFFDRGTHFVTMPIHEIYYGHAVLNDYTNGEWWMHVILSLEVGKDIYTALADADEYLYGVMTREYNNQNCRHTLGDGSIKIIASTSTATSPLQTAGLANAANRMAASNFLSTVTPVMNTASGHYKDSSNNLYQLKSSGKVSSYIANTDSLELGDYVVNQTVALKTTQNFLTKMGVSVSDCTMTYSNAYSKTFRVVYENDVKRISLTLKADQNGNVYITHYFNTDKEVLS